jgi:nicotinate-nucleotide adenylyltransferase
MTRLGLFGGSFDPVHLGHLLVAEAAREELGLARLFFIPAAQSPFKPASQPAPAAQRLRLLRLALAGRPWCELDEQELRRGGVSYTIDTVRDYARRFPDAELFYLIGADHAAQLPRWREAARLAELTQFVILPRPDQAPTPNVLAPPAPDAADPHGLPPDASARPAPSPRAPGPGAQAAELPAPFRGCRLAGFPLAVSSSQIRERLRAGLAIEALVPGPVAEAIRNDRLYL